MRTLSTQLPRLIYESEADFRASEDQCDCACAATFTLSGYSASPSPQQLHCLKPNFWATPLNHTHQAVLIEESARLVLLNQPAIMMADYFRQPHLLTDYPPDWAAAWGQITVQNTLQEMAGLGVLAPVGPQPVPTETPVALAAWLHLTDRCNLRCSYCYLPHQPLDMSLETGQAAIAATFRSAIAHNYPAVKLKYAGGEALLRFDLITQLHPYAQKLAQAHRLNLEGVILSNGTCLTAAMVQTMQKLDLRLMISLDGLGEMHDRQRSFANGPGSFDRVAQAINLALAHGLTPDISVTVSGRNVAGLPDLLDWLLERDLPFSLNFYRENDLSQAHTALELEEEQLMSGLQAAFKVIEAGLPRRSLLPSLVDRANLATPHRRTCGAGHSYLVFDPSGRVSKCQMQLHHHLTTAAAGDPLTLLCADPHGLQNLPVEEKEGCRDCAWKYWCTGGCPLATYRATGRYDVKSPYCRLYQALYPQVVRLEGLRLLQHVNRKS